ncbi:hypothetical protein M8J76_000814 [Diaphorina citri]|nr:hypothetical protein M8J76_000814 [Diaphorina citri]
MRTRQISKPLYSLATTPDLMEPCPKPLLVKRSTPQSSTTRTRIRENSRPLRIAFLFLVCLSTNENRCAVQSKVDKPVSIED